jgi:hypothetical protein
MHRACRGTDDRTDARGASIRPASRKLPLGICNTTVSVTGNSTVTVQCGNYSADLTTTIKLRVDLVFGPVFDRRRELFQEGRFGRGGLFHNGGGAPRNPAGRALDDHVLVAQQAGHVTQECVVRLDSAWLAAPHQNTEAGRCDQLYEQRRLARMRPADIL